MLLQMQIFLHIFDMDVKVPVHTDTKCDLFEVYVLASQIKLMQTLLTREIAIYR